MRGMTAVDTLSLARDLRAASVPTEHAEAIASAIGRAVPEGAATKADLATLRSELKADLATLRSELKADMADLKSSLLTWFIGSQVALGAIIIAALKL
jgi:Skp family chaperone for outer membrane proteins